MKIKTPQKEMLDQLRYWLKAGATIKAIDPKCKVLEFTNNIWYTNLIIDFQNSKHPVKIS